MFIYLFIYLLFFFGGGGLLSDFTVLYCYQSFFFCFTLSSIVLELELPLQQGAVGTFARQRDGVMVGVTLVFG